MTAIVLDRPASPVSPVALLERFSSHPSAFLALNRETRHFTTPHLEGLIAYRPCGGWLFQLGSIFAAPDDQARLFEAFRAFARIEGKRICALQLRPEDVPLYRDAGFRLNQLGTSFTLDLELFETKGARFMQLRNKVKRAKREGVSVAELGVDRPRSEAVERQLEEITAAWLAGKGRSKKLLDFMVGELGGEHGALRRTFVALRGEEVLGFTTFVPAWGRLEGVMLDLSRRTPDAPPGVTELVNVTAFERFQKEGVRHMSFGLTPFVGLSDATDSVAGRSGVVSWILRFLAKHGGAVYPAASQAHYKEKWNPTILVPEYLAFEGRFRLGCLLRLLLLTRSI